MKILKSIFCVLLIFFSLNNFCVAENSSSSSQTEIVNPDWTIAATPFYFSQNKKRNEYENSMLKNIPTLILEQLYGTKIRNIPNDEILNRKLDELLKKRLALFLDLSKEQKTKDALILQDLSEYVFNKKKIEQDKKIEKIQKSIQENLEAQEKLLKDFSEESGDFSRLKLKNSTEENFVFYKNSSNELFNFSEKILLNDLNQPDIKSFDAQKEILDAKISALITGSITTYGDYAAVTIELNLFPGAKSIYSITEIGLLSKPEIIAKNIAYKLIPKIENAIPCEIFISILPEDLKAKTKLTIDSTVYNEVPEKLILSSGVHNFVFECEDYKTESFSYGFGYEKKYSIEVTFDKYDPVDLALVLKKSIEGNIFYNGKKADSNKMAVKINNQSVLGFFSTQNDNTLFFIIPEKQVIDDNVISAKFKDYDISDFIEKRRRMMYISYSALVCSLPFMFYSYSNYATLARSYNSQVKDISIDEIMRYRKMSYVGIGITAACGVWFLVDLILYLNSANKALPVEAKNSKIDFDKAVDDFNLMQTDLKQNRELLDKKENENLKDESQVEEKFQKENSTEENFIEENLNDENQKQNFNQVENEKIDEKEKINNENFSGEKNG